MVPPFSGLTWSVITLSVMSPRMLATHALFNDYLTNAARLVIVTSAARHSTCPLVSNKRKAGGQYDEEYRDNQSFRSSTHGLSPYDGVYSRSTSGVILPQYKNCAQRITIKNTTAECFLTRSHTVCRFHH